MELAKAEDMLSFVLVERRFSYLQDGLRNSVKCSAIYTKCMISLHMFNPSLPTDFCCIIENLDLDCLLRSKEALSDWDSWGQ